MGAPVRRHLPILLVLAGALAIGVWGDQAAWVDPSRYAPRTAFTSGHLLAHAVARASFEQGWFLAPEVNLVGWPMPASFRALMWPSAALAVVLPPLVAVNLVFVLIPLFNAGCGYLLGRAWLPGDGAARNVGATLTAGLCAWHPWVRETLANGQLEQACVGVIALVWAAAAWARRGGPARWVGVGLLQALVAVSAPHLGLAGAFGLGLIALVDVAADRRLWRPWAGVLGMGAAGTLAAAAYHVSGFSSASQVLWPKGSHGHPAGLPGLAESATLTSLFWPPAATVSEGLTFHPNFLGWALLIGAAFGVRKAGAVGVRAGLVVAGALVLISLGPTLAPGVPGPYALFGLISDTLAQSQSPYRFLSGGVVALALVAGAAVRTPAVALVLVGIAWVETARVGLRPFPPATQDFEADAVVAPFRARTGPILDLPFASGTCPAGNVHYVIEATRRLRPTPASMATTAVYASVPGLQGKVLGMSRDRQCGALLAPELARWGFTTVVLHQHAGCPSQPGLVRCLEDAFGPGEAAPELRWWDLADPAGP